MSGKEQRAYAEQLVAQVPEIEQATNYVILDELRYIETADGDKVESDRLLATSTGPAFADLFTTERVAGAPLTKTSASVEAASRCRRLQRSGLAVCNGSFGGLPVRPTLEAPPATSR